MFNKKLREEVRNYMKRFYKMLVRLEFLEKENKKIESVLNGEMPYCTNTDETYAGYPYYNSSDVVELHRTKISYAELKREVFENHQKLYFQNQKIEALEKFLNVEWVQENDLYPKYKKITKNKNESSRKNA
jgi:hypothetical protein